MASRSNTQLSLQQYQHSTTSMRTRSLDSLTHVRRGAVTRGSPRKVWLLGLRVDVEMRRHVVCAYLGLCVLTVISVSNYFLIRSQGDQLEENHQTLLARMRRHDKRAEPDYEPVYALPRAMPGDSPEIRPVEAPKDPPAPAPLAQAQDNADSGPVKNVYYVKVHKAGSTTLQNIMFRFALKHDLRVAIYNRPWGMPYPEYARPEFLYEDMSHPEFSKYNMICDHTVYHRDTVAPYMAGDYESVAILREPYSHLVSAFDFWGLAKRFRLHKSRDPLRDFLTKNPDQYKHITPHFNRTKNMQAYHFGHLDYHDNSNESTARLIEHVDKHFKLVMLRERFEESLILMRRLFRWNFADILYMDQFVNTQPRAKLRSEQEDSSLRSVHKRFASVDYALYDHFSTKLDKMAAAEGESLSAEVLYFKETNRKVAEFCENVCSLFPYETIKNLTVDDILPKLKEGITFAANQWHEEIHLTYANCAYMKFWTYQYHNALRVKQLPASCPSNQGEGPPPAQTVFDPHDLQKYGYCETDKRILFNFPLDVFKEIVLDVPMHPVTNAKIAKAPKCKGRSEPT